MIVISNLSQFVSGDFSWKVKLQTSMWWTGRQIGSREDMKSPGLLGWSEICLEVCTISNRAAIMGLNETMVVDHERQQIKCHTRCSWWFRDVTAILPTRNYQVGSVFLAFRNGWHLLTRLSFSQRNMRFHSLFLKHISTQERFRLRHPGILITGSGRKLKACQHRKQNSSPPPQSHKVKHETPFSEEKFTFSLGEVSMLGRELPDSLSPVRLQLHKKTSILHGISPLY